MIAQRYANESFIHVSAAGRPELRRNRGDFCQTRRAVENFARSAARGSTRPIPSRPCAKPRSPFRVRSRSFLAWNYRSTRATVEDLCDTSDARRTKSSREEQLRTTIRDVMVPASFVDSTRCASRPIRCCRENFIAPDRHRCARRSFIGIRECRSTKFSRSRAPKGARCRRRVIGAEYACTLAALEVRCISLTDAIRSSVSHVAKISEKSAPDDRGCRALIARKSGALRCAATGDAPHVTSARRLR